MKQFFIIIHVLFSVFVSAQYYEFDYMILSEDKPLHIKFRGPLEYKRFINSNNNSYELRLPVQLKSGKVQSAAILDRSLNLYHTFTLLPSANEPETAFILKYLKTDHRRRQKKLYSNIQVRKIKDSIYEITADIEKQRNVDLKQVKLFVNLLENEDDLTNLFNLDVPGPIEIDMIAELKKNLDSSKNYFIREHVIQYIPGATFYEKVNETKKIRYKVDLRDNKKVMKLIQKQLKRKK